MNTNPNTQLIPPFRFAIIEEGLYRGSYPTEKNFRFLKRLKLKTIVSLTPKPPTKPFLNFCERYGTTSKHFAVSKFKDDVTISASQVVQLLELMIDPSNLPLYCHCLDGANVTGTIFMCLRKLQNWNLSAIISEFTRFTRGSCITSSESEFVETFKAEIDVPLTIPPWLWQGVRMSKHPTLKLRLVNSVVNVHGVGGVGGHGVMVPSSTPLSSSSATFVNIPPNQLNSLVSASLNTSSTSPFSSLASSSSPIISTTATINNTTTTINLINNTSNVPTTPTTSSSSISLSSLSSQLQQLQQQQDNTSNSSSSLASVNAPSSLSAQTQQSMKLFDTQSPRASISSPPNTPMNPSTSSVGSISNLLTSGNPKDKDKKKKIEEIKLQFDAGKFNLPVESKSLDALALERSPPLNHTSSQSNSANATTTTSTISSTTSSGNNSTFATPTTNRTLLQTSSEFTFTNVNLFNTLNNNNNTTSSTPPPPPPK